MMKKFVSKDNSGSLAPPLFTGNDEVGRSLVRECLQRPGANLPRKVEREGGGDSGYHNRWLSGELHSNCQWLSQEHLNQGPAVSRGCFCKRIQIWGSLIYSLPQRTISPTGPVSLWAPISYSHQGINQTTPKDLPSTQAHCLFFWTKVLRSLSKWKTKQNIFCQKNSLQSSIVCSLILSGHITYYAIYV